MTIYRRNPRIDESPLQDEIMLYDNEKSQFYVMNSTMAHVWQHCDGERGVEEIAATLPGHFSGAETHPVREEMDAAIRELLSLDLIEAVR
ncbi:hypothetical protein SPAN111604_04235 [Sphingomonas antarctica]|uniref:PqqD family protein n=1 Tax=Sphingomonas antarctica TaxID=2040274 RepID=UPI0039E8E74C